MTHQDFNHFYFKFTGNKKGIRLSDRLCMTGYDLKEFIAMIIDSEVFAIDECV